jgi:NAD(P)-dependent dehydrogenase (short-subunit alcohol dehydrogenase family)
MDLEPDDVAVVTGAGSGIGRALTQAFVARGLRVVAADVDESGLAETARQVAAATQSDGLRTRHCDVSAAAAVEGLAEFTAAEFGRCDVLCNNAGVSLAGPLWQMTHADWEFVLGVNLWGVVNGIRAFVPQMVAADHGYVVNTASFAGLVRTGTLGSYNASKAAVIALSETLLHDLRRANAAVGVGVLCPSWVRTGMGRAESHRPESLRNADGEGIPTEVAAERLALTQAQLDQGQDPADTAAIVVQGILDDVFWMFSHPELAPVLPMIANSIVAGETPTDFGF